MGKINYNARAYLIILISKVSDTFLRFSGKGVGHFFLLEYRYGKVEANCGGVGIVDIFVVYKKGYQILFGHD